ncbi:MAG: GTPase Era [Rubricoccaceae bacterium]|nr:GTPase Era [Rubricoccaceae bacterium]
MEPEDPPQEPPGEPAFAPDFADVPPDHRSGYVALVGAPNVGKSTLLNRLLGTKLSIVTPKPSTTRHRVLGILSAEPTDERPPYQIVFVDTPGVVRPRYRLHDLMMADVDRALGDADVVVLLVDAAEGKLTHDARGAVERLATVQAPVILALNKVDLIRQEEALPLVERYAALRAPGAPLDEAFDEILPLSAQTGVNVDRLLNLLVDRLPPGPPYYPRDQLSEHPERFFIAEIVREAVFYRYRDEVPYSTQVNVVQYEERPGRKDFVACEIVVERESQKAILIGKGGKALKALGAAARQEVEAFLGRPVYLQLHVKARADWRNREGFLRSYGYGR